MVGCTPMPTCSRQNINPVLLVISFKDMDVRLLRYHCSIKNVSKSKASCAPRTLLPIQCLSSCKFIGIIYSSHTFFSCSNISKTQHRHLRSNENLKKSCAELEKKGENKKEKRKQKKMDKREDKKKERKKKSINFSSLDPKF